MIKNKHFKKYRLSLAIGKYKIFYLFFAGFLISIPINAQNNVPVIVLVEKPEAVIQPAMWGIFFEDINFAADGGIYAELVKNRSFEFAMPLKGWKELKQENTSNNVLIINNSGSNPLNPRFARITVDAVHGKFGLCNEGFRGMGVKKDMVYH